MNKISKRALSAALALTITGSACIVPVITANADGDAVISITFDEDSDSYTLHGGTLVDGRDGKALSLDGAKELAQYADINDNAAKLAGITGDFSISVWFNPSSISTWARLYDLGNDTTKNLFLTESSGSYPRFAIKNGAEQYFDSDTNFTAGSWHNAVITRKNGVSTFYVDGFETGTSTAITTNISDLGTMSRLYIGKSQYDDPYYAGLIDDLKIYDYALNVDQVHTLAAEVYEAKRNAQIYENNCYVVNTHFYDADNNEIFAYNKPAAFDGAYISGGASITDTQAFCILENIDNHDLDGITAYVAQYASDNSLIGLTMEKLQSGMLDTMTNPVRIAYEKLPEAADVKLFVWKDMKPIREEAPSISFTSTVENDTTQNGEVKLSVYSVDGVNGYQTKLAESDTIALASLESKDITVNVPQEGLPVPISKFIVKIDTGDGEEYEAASLYCGITGPAAAPADSNETTNGAHDPSIVRFPDDDTYYAYSSHHLIFTSKDLINWKKYDFTNVNAKNISPKTYNFISSNYTNTTMNGTYWAPDVIYVPERDSKHPYWMYISLSCGLGGRNSAISLMKSDKPLFWADPSSDIVDEGVVFATKETSGYITNAIDANIYTDTDGTKYFVWGSFWGGIQAAKLNENGFVEGIDYTSDSTILNTCRNFGTTIYSQKNGAAGPEGAWMHNNGDYRYAYTSYGWLGSNYNTRVARSAVSTSFGTNMGEQLTDANRVVVGTQYSKGSLSSPSGYKLIGSYRLGDGSMTVVKGDNNYYVARGADDAHIYYGSGHNSVITAPDGEVFYCSHFRKDAVEGAAILQIRKVLYTSDGWPVVSSVSYAGEIEQALPKDMLYGTYDLASVGKTKMDGSQITTSGSLTDKNYDLPVLSSKITLNADNTLADSLGTWEFDGDHTITLKFTKDGDTSKDEFYKNGDTMTMYALYGYDKDENVPVIALTGTNQNHITQFAKKRVTNIYKTPVKAASETEPVSITKSAGGNPELGFDAGGSTLYGGDPAATVIGDTVYLIVGHDTATDESYVMPEWVLYTSKNMTDWEYKGTIMKATDISWRRDDTSAWASQMTEYNGKYYLYFCTWDKTSNGSQSIGVAVADNPEGPYKDIGSPLVKGTFTSPETSTWNDIDPTVLIDTDDKGEEHRYLAWGNGKYYICELNEDMTSVKDLDGDGKITMHVDVKERKIKSMNGGVYTEAPWLYKRDGKYYLFYAMNLREEMAYAMTDDPMGRYDFKQIIMPPTATSNTNHPSVIDFNGKTYFIYHNGALPHGSGFRRSVCVQELEFDENGYVIPLTETSTGITGTASTIVTSDNKYVGHNSFRNPLSDASYPISTAVTVSNSENGYNTAWELVEPKSVPDGEDAKYYVSIQSVNKPGLYIASTGSGITLTQDADGKQGGIMTFKTVKGLDGKENTVSFKNADGKYITVLSGAITLSYGTTPSDCSFTIGRATAKDKNAVTIAEIEAEPDPEKDVESDFNSASAGRIMSIETTEQLVNKTYPGADLYIGTRPGGAEASTNWSIESGAGVDSSNALVMNSNKYVSASRGPRVQITTPAIPNGYVVTGTFEVKLGKGAKLYYNDSTGSQATAELTGLSESDWSTVKVTIQNDSDTYKRTMYVNDSEIAADYVDQFPVFWGTNQDGTGTKIYFDNFAVKTTTASGETPVVNPVTLPSPIAEYSFDDTLEDSISKQGASLTGSKVSEAAKVSEPVYAEGKSGKAISFSGSGSYGLMLEAKPKSSNYTISFDAKLNASATYSPFIFIADYDNGAIKGADANAQWLSIAPQGWQETLANGPMIWSRDVTGGNAWNDVYTANNNSISLNTWHRIAVSAAGGKAAIYVDGTKIAEGNIANIIDDTTKVFLGVNDWDTPLDGYIDNLRIYGSALSEKQIQLIE